MFKKIRKVTAVAGRQILLFLTISLFFVPHAFSQEIAVDHSRSANNAYAYSDNDIPPVCFFPADKSRWNGNELLNEDWGKLTEYQKNMFVSEGMKEIERKESVAVKAVSGEEFQGAIKNLDWIAGITVSGGAKATMIIFLSKFLEEMGWTKHNVQGSGENKISIFNNNRGDVSIHYPQGWFVKEYIYNNPYSIFLSREKVEASGDMFKAGITVKKYYHQSWYRGLDNIDVRRALNASLDSYSKSMPKDEEIKEKKWITIDGVEALMAEMVCAPFSYKIRLYILLAMKDDVLVQFILEAPDAEFENYRPLFDETIKTVRIFSKDSSDNAIFDNEIESLLVNKAMKIRIDAKENILEIVKVFNDIKAMSPLYAKTIFLSGTFFLELGKLANEAQKSVLAKAEEEFKLAIDLYIKYSQDYNELDRKLNISQCYYLLGDIYYFFYDKKGEARNFYEKSLIYFSHSEAKRKLREYFGA